MNLNETDARAIDMLLGGSEGFPVETAAGAAGGLGLPSTPAADFMQSAGAMAVSDMTDEFSSRVSHVDDILRLLDYLPADEPPPTLLDKTLQRINESRPQSSAPASTASFVVPPLARPPAALHQNIPRSLDLADGDPATA